MTASGLGECSRRVSSRETSLMLPVFVAIFQNARTQIAHLCTRVFEIGKRRSAVKIVQ